MTSWTAVPATSYQSDVIGLLFKQHVLPQPDDYEGSIRSTLFRFRSTTQGAEAVLYFHGFNNYFFQKEMAQCYQEHEYQFYDLDLRKYGRSLLPH